MGTLRTLLAVAVVCVHCWPEGLVLVGSVNAVRLFYIISGFLISYVLHEQKAYRRTRVFYLNRWLRLFPTYAVVALAALAWRHFAGTGGLPAFGSLPAAARAMLIVSNLFIFGQDWVLFTAVKDHHLVPSGNFRTSDVPLFRYLLVPQAWTLGLELCFYLLAPFVVTTAWVLYPALAVSAAVKVALSIGLGLKHDPWNYRFFPSELSLFLVGAAAQKLLYPLYRKRWDGPALRRISAVATGYLIALIACYPWLPGTPGARNVLVFSSFVMLLPFAFIFQSHNRLDRLIGELSYPLYIGHFLVISILAGCLTKWGILNHVQSTWVVVPVSIAFAMVLNATIGRTVEGWRTRIKRAKIETPGARA